MDDLLDEEAREVLRQARAHMDPTVFDRARVARKLESTRMAWDGQHTVQGEPLPDPFAHADPIAATTVSAGKLGALKLVCAVTVGLLVGDAFVGSRVTEVASTRTAPVGASPELVAKTPPELREAKPLLARVSAPARDERSPEWPPERAPTDAARVPRRAKPARIHAHATRAAIQEPKMAEVAPAQALRAEPHMVPDRLSLDIRLLRQAAQALYAGRAGQALTLLNEHARRFSRSETRHERHALAFQAACALGQVETAELHRQVLLREAPGGALAARVHDGCVDRSTK